MRALTLKWQWQIFPLRFITWNDVTCLTAAFLDPFLMILQTVSKIVPKGLTVKHIWPRKPKSFQKVTVIARKFFIKSANNSRFQIVVETFESNDMPNCSGYVLEKDNFKVLCWESTIQQYLKTTRIHYGRIARCSSGLRPLSPCEIRLNATGLLCSSVTSMYENCSSSPLHNG